MTPQPTPKQQAEALVLKIAYIASCDNAQAIHRFNRLTEEGIVDILAQLFEDKTQLDWLQTTSLDMLHTVNAEPKPHGFYFVDEEGFEERTPVNESLRQAITSARQKEQE